jgi:uncharacterized protein (TIGR01777 family)
MPRILVTGASGFLGTALTRRLSRDGHQVIPLGRRPRSPGAPSWDPATGRLDPATFAGVDAVVHLAGASIAGGLWTRARKRRIRESRVEGTTLLARTMAGLAEPPRVLVSISAVGIYGDRGDTVLDETSPAGSGFLAEVGMAWEAATQAAGQAGIRVVLPRLGIVLDPGGGMLRQLLPVFRLGLGARLGSGRQWMSWVVMADLLEALVLLIHAPELSGPVNIVTPEPATNAQFTAALAAALHRPAFLRAPAPILRLAMGQLADELLLGSQRCAPGRLGQAGFQFTHPEIGGALAALVGEGSESPPTGTGST